MYATMYYRWRFNDPPGAGNFQRYPENQQCILTSDWPTIQALDSSKLTLSEHEGRLGLHERIPTIPSTGRVQEPRGGRIPNRDCRAAVARIKSALMVKRNGRGVSPVRRRVGASRPPSTNSPFKCQLVPNAVHHLRFKNSHGDGINTSRQRVHSCDKNEHFRPTFTRSTL